MRLRLIFSFAVVILVTLLTVAYFVRQSTEQEVQVLIYRGGIYGAEGLVIALENHYQEFSTWDGVETLFLSPGSGRGDGQGFGQGKGPGGGQGSGASTDLKLYDVDRNLIYDPQNPNSVGKLEADVFNSAIELVVEGFTVGYLSTPQGQEYNQELETSLLERMNRASINAALIAGGLSLLLAMFLAFYLLQPVRRLTKAVAKLTEGDLSQRVNMRGNDEIATLGSAFDQMAASLEAEQNRRRMMTADIAHELRTPLSVQRVNLEAMLDGIEAKTNENIRIVLEQNQLLERLVEDLRTLAMVDAGELSLKRSPTNLNKLIINVIENFQQRAKQKNIQLKTEFDKIPLVMNLDQVRVEQILVNLIENSLRYSPQEGEVWVRTIHHKHEVLVEVQDTGPGISEDELPHIFERFYRGDSSRSREQGGTGLGLAISRKLAEAHGGRLTATNHPEGGTVFRLTLLKN